MKPPGLLPHHQITERIRRGQSIPLVLALPLSAATLITRLGMAHRLRQSRVRVAAQVVSFGNLTAGGTGKTPAVIERAEREIGAGRRVAVITRGYGSRRVREPYAVTSAEAPGALYEWVGDEPALILRRVPEVVMVKSANRIAGARYAVEELGCDSLILDDAFQAVRLKRDENILVVDATNPFGNGHLIPRGILREPMAGAMRATHVILTRCDQVEHTHQIDELISTVRGWCPDAPLRTTRHAPQRLWRVATGEALPLATLRDTEIAAASAIGNPDAFHRTLESLGARLTASLAIRDHAQLALNMLRQDLPCVVTEKDAVRMEGPPGNVLALGIGLEDWPRPTI